MGGLQFSDFDDAPRFDYREVAWEGLGFPHFVDTLNFDYRKVVAGS